MTPAMITGTGQAFPPAVGQDALWEGYFRKHFDDNALARRLFANAGPKQRHAVVNPLIEDASGWSTEKRMARYLPEALPLANEAVRAALADAELSPDEVGQLIVVSCTGYATPGLDSFIARDVAMNTSVQRLMLGHMGCHAALPAIATASDFVAVSRQPAVVVCVELGSLHVQPTTTDTEQMVAHALFSDAASAVVLQPVPTSTSTPTSTPAPTSGFEVLDRAVIADVDNASLMTWDVTDFGFRMGLSQRIPDVLERHVEPLIDALLRRHSLSVDHVAGWAVHPGGPRIIDVVERALKLDAEKLGASRNVLAQHGNCSSATVLLVLDELRRTSRFSAGDHVIAMAFGPGLTLAAVLLGAR